MDNDRRGRWPLKELGPYFRYKPSQSQKVSFVILSHRCSCVLKRQEQRSNFSRCLPGQCTPGGTGNTPRHLPGADGQGDNALSSGAMRKGQGKVCFPQPRGNKHCQVFRLRWGQGEKEYGNFPGKDGRE